MLTEDHSARRVTANQFQFWFSPHIDNFPHHVIDRETKTATDAYQYFAIQDSREQGIWILPHHSLKLISYTSE